VCRMVCGDVHNEGQCCTDVNPCEFEAETDSGDGSEEGRERVPRAASLTVER
jgi:hypothetical protein